MLRLIWQLSVTLTFPILSPNVVDLMTTYTYLLLSIAVISALWALDVFNSKYILGLILLASALLYRTMTNRDPYGSFHLSLNKTSHDAAGSPTTEWMNMGFWKV